MHEKSNDQEKVCNLFIRYLILKMQVIETLTASNRRLIQENDKLREEFEGLQDDYTSQQHVIHLHKRSLTHDILDCK